jgi:hypothetical protein
MTMPGDVRNAEYIVDSSGIVETLLAATRTSNRGRKGNPHALRLMLIGMFLSIHCNGKATLRDIHKLLTEELCWQDQVRLSVRTTDRSGRAQCLAYDDLRYASKTIKNKLGYGRSTIAKAAITDDMRDFRHETITKFNSDLMDVFDLGWNSTMFAMDATGLWSWANGKGSKADNFAETKTPWPGPNTTVHKVDPDGTWMTKTAKDGGSESFFGYFEHTLIQVPDSDDTDAEPRVIRRLELATANEDVVAVSLRLIDGLNGQVKDLIVDRLYSNTVVTRWLQKLRVRKINQHLDLRADQQGFTEFAQMRWAAGSPHCPSTPDSYGSIPKPALNSPDHEFDAFHKLIDQRQRYTFQIVNQPNEKGAMKVRCPALYGKVGCPLRDGSVAVAIEGGLPIIENAPQESAEGLPACCTQDTVRVTPPDSIAKATQVHYWGSRTWTKVFSRRTYVEGSYGNRKNPSTENLRRGLTRGMGLPWMNIIVSMTAASYNLRMIHNWHERTGKGDPSHPLLTEHAKPAGFTYFFEHVDQTDVAIAAEAA